MKGSVLDRRLEIEIVKERPGHSKTIEQKRYSKQEEGHESGKGEIAVMGLVRRNMRMEGGEEEKIEKFSRKGRYCRRGAG